jgi:uncharacterized protein (TIGR03437 family)
MTLRALLLLAATPLFAQFSQFAATDDGQQVYFLSPLVFDGSPATQNTESRLYRIGPDGVFLVAQRPVQAGLSGFSGGSGDGVSNPQVSGDGSVVGFTYRNYCPAAPCGFPIPAEAQILGSKTTGTTDLGPGILQLSRNGRWALLSSPDGLSATLNDLSTGKAVSVPQPHFPTGQLVASDGTVLTQTGLWKDGQTSPLPAIGYSFTPISLSDNASTVAGYAIAGLVTLSLATGVATTIQASTTSTSPFFMAMSNDGSRILYRVTGLAVANGSAFVADTATGQSTLIALPAGETALDGTLSGDGSIAFLTTTSGRIVTATLATGAVEPLIPPTPYISFIGQLAIGSLTHLQTTYPGTAADWSGRILLDGQALPVLGVKPGVVDVQVPWERAAGLAQFKITAGDGSPFQQIAEIFVTPLAPAFEQLDPGASAILPIKIIKGDWSGYLTTQPNAGDIVYIYMTGLGPVSGPVQTGVPASTTSPNPIQGTLTCTFTPQTTPAVTLFAGLAPGFIGVYQTAFQIPADPNTKPLNGMQCSLNGQAYFAFTVIPAGTLP